MFYNYDQLTPVGKRQDFLYTYNRHNEFNLNIGVLKANYETQNMRSNLALMTGTYASDNMLAEKDVYKMIHEANVGFKISKSKNLWIDAGIMPSHIGWETVIGKDNLTLTRSLAAENSPYFETGAKLSYTSDSGKWFLSGILLNGWQRIARAEGNTSLSIGHQLTYKPNSSTILNSSSFIGNDKPSSDNRMRYFHDFFVSNQWNSKLQTIFGVDVGLEQKQKQSSEYNTWYTINAIGKYQWNNETSIGARIEYFVDKNNVVIAPQNGLGFHVLGVSANIDYLIYKNILWRTEVRNFSAKDPIFLKGDTQTYYNQNLFFTTSISAWF